MKPTQIERSDFGIILDAIRVERGDTLRGIAQQYNLWSDAIIYAREYPLKHRPTARLLAALADYTGMSVDDILALMENCPAMAGEIEYPLVTHIGIKYQPTRNYFGVSCERCPRFEPCRHDVIERDGFAHCEKLLPVDQLNPDVAAIVSQNYEEDRYGVRDLARSQ